jgi:hypothetical protein
VCVCVCVCVCVSVCLYLYMLNRVCEYNKSTCMYELGHRSHDTN